MWNNKVITISAEIWHGAPVIRCIRVPVRITVGSVASGMTAQHILREYDLAAHDIRAAIAFNQGPPKR
jgi:uncharacterized protein (DUF433 family)